MQVLCDIGGITLVLLTWMLFLFTDRTTSVFVLDRWFCTGIPSTTNLLTCNTYTSSGYILLFTFRFLVILALVSHVRAVVCDPGSLKETPVVPPATVHGPRICKSCGDRWKPPRAHHCRKCKRCIFRMDHHCPWINNCVGLMNQKYFILFLIYTVTSCSLNLILLLFGGIFWLRDSSASYMDIQSTFCISFSIIVSAFFFSMALNFLSEQYEALSSNSTLVESHQSTHGIKVGLYQHLKSVFGSCILLYPFPIAPSIDVDYQEPVFLDETVVEHLKHKSQRKRRELNAKMAEQHRELRRMDNSKLEQPATGHEQLRRRGWKRNVAGSTDAAGQQGRVGFDFFSDYNDLSNNSVSSEDVSAKGSRGPPRMSARGCHGTEKRLISRSEMEKEEGIQLTTRSIYSSETEHCSAANLRYLDGSPCYMNIYVKPKHDIGLDDDDDDESHFVCLTSGSSGSVTEDDNFYNSARGGYAYSNPNEDSELLGPSNLSNSFGSLRQVESGDEKFVNRNSSEVVSSRNVGSTGQAAAFRRSMLRPRRQEPVSSRSALAKVLASPQGKMDDISLRGSNETRD